MKCGPVWLPGFREEPTGGLSGLVQVAHTDHLPPTEMSPRTARRARLSAAASKEKSAPTLIGPRTRARRPLPRASPSVSMLLAPMQYTRRLMPPRRWQMRSAWTSCRAASQASPIGLDWHCGFHSNNQGLFIRGDEIRLHAMDGAVERDRERPLASKGIISHLGQQLLGKGPLESSLLQVLML